MSVTVRVRLLHTFLLSVLNVFTASKEGLRQLQTTAGASQREETESKGGRSTSKTFKTTSVLKTAACYEILKNHVRSHLLRLCLIVGHFLKLCKCRIAISMFILLCRIWRRRRRAVKGGFNCQFWICLNVVFHFLCLHELVIFSA